MPKVKDVLPEQNPWWTGGFELAYKERELYAEVRRFLRLPQIVALTGLRRVGKTTLMLKAAQDALAGGLDPRRILYFSFDEFKGVEIREVLREYEALVERDLRTGRFLVLFDEVQK
ncbi:MAG: AAA family ATPase, partial [Thermoplasmata archaeon]